MASFVDRIADLRAKCKVMIAAVVSSLNNDLSKFDDWMHTIERAVIECINKRKVFSDEWLLAVWQWRAQNSENMENSHLWTAMQSQISQIIDISNVSTDTVGWRYFNTVFQHSPV